MLDAGTGVAEGSEIVQGIVQDWERRQQIQGFRYLVGGTHVVPKGWFSEDHGQGSLRVPSEDVVIEIKSEYFVDLERNRSRIENDLEDYHWDTGVFIRWFRVLLYDGQHSQIFFPRDRNRHIFDRNPWHSDLEFPPNSTGPAFGRVDLPVLLAHGMVPVGGGSTLSSTGTLRRNLNAEYFTVYGRAVRDGRECVVLRSQTDRTGPNPAFREIWVDVEKDSAILRYVRYIGDSETFQIDLWYDEDDGLGFPLARYVLMVEFEGKLVQTRDAFVLEYEAEPAFTDSLFYMEPQPGFNVNDYRTRRRYRVGLPGQPDRDLAELAMEMDRGYRSSARFLFLAMNVLVIVVGGLYFIQYLKRRKARPA